MKNCLIPLMLAVAVQAAEVKQIFRPERYERGNVNIVPIQPIDEASGVWLPGYDVWGGAVFSETRAKGLLEKPSFFARFRKEFSVAAGGAPL